MAILQVVGSPDESQALQSHGAGVHTVFHQQDPNRSAVVLNQSLFMGKDGKTTIWEEAERQTRSLEEYVINNIAYGNVAYGEFNDRITLAQTGYEISQLEGVMQHYVMAHPDMRARYNAGADFYDNWTPTTYDAKEDPFYIRMHDGIMVEEGDSYVVYDSITDDLDDTSLTFSQQLDLMLTHRAIDRLQLSELFDEFKTYE